MAGCEGVVTTMRKIVIIGAGHLAVDIYDVIVTINRERPIWEVVGFLNDFPVDMGKYGIREKVIGPVNGWVPRAGEEYVMAIGNSQAKANLTEMFKRGGARFPVIVSRYAMVNDTAVIGEGSVIVSTSKIARDVKIGRFVTIGDATVGRGAEIGDFSNLASYVNVYQDVKVGKRVQLWSNSVILNSVGDDAVVGAGSVVVTKVKPGIRVFGVPAKKMEF